MGVVEERANNFVDEVLARIIKELRCVRISVMDISMMVT
jgi:hypothetical protein